MELGGFINASEILRSGVYALVWKGEVVYIGKSKAMLVRIYSHRSAARGKSPSWLPVKGIVFDEVHIRPCSLAVIDELEYQMINLYKPKYNILLKHTGKSSAPITLNINGLAISLNAQPSRPAPQIERRI